MTIEESRSKVSLRTKWSTATVTASYP